MVIKVYKIYKWGRRFSKLVAKILGDIETTIWTFRWGISSSGLADKKSWSDSGPGRRILTLCYVY